MNLEIVEIDPRDDAAYAAWHHVYDEAEERNLGEFSAHWSLESLRVRFTEPDRSRRWHCFAGRLEKGGETVCAGFVGFLLLDNLSIADVFVHTLPEHERRGYGGQMLAQLEAQAVTAGRRLGTMEVSWPTAAGSQGRGAAGAEFATKHGYVLGLSDVQRQLDLPVSRQVLDRLAAHVAPSHSAYTLKTWVGPIPEDLLLPWLTLDSSLMTEAPLGDLELEDSAINPAAHREQERQLAKMGRAPVHTVAIDAAGEVVAYSDLMTSSKYPERVWQWGTLVRPADRGHGLGLATKVANLQALQAGFPDARRVTTFNAEVNQHMIAVNEALGFRPVARMGEFQKRL